MIPGMKSGMAKRSAAMFLSRFRYLTETALTLFGIGCVRNALRVSGRFKIQGTMETSVNRFDRA